MKNCRKIRRIYQYMRNFKLKSQDLIRFLVGMKELETTSMINKNEHLLNTVKKLHQLELFRPLLQDSNQTYQSIKKYLISMMTNYLVNFILLLKTSLKRNLLLLGKHVNNITLKPSHNSNIKEIIITKISKKTRFYKLTFKKTQVTMKFLIQLNKYLNNQI